MKLFVQENALKKNPVFAGFLFLIALFFIVSCTTKRGEIANKPLLRVNESDLITKDFADKLAHKMRAFDALAAKSPGNINRAKEEIIKDFILQVITRRWAKEHGVAISNDVLEKKINELRANYPDDIAFRQELAKENISFDEWKERLSYSLLERAVHDKITSDIQAPTEKEMQEYYRDNSELFKQDDRIFLYQIVCEKESAASAVLAELKKGASFSTMAKKYSVAPEGSTGGQVGWIDRGTLEVFDKAFKLPLGQVSNVFESPYGYHIFKVEKTQRAGIISFTDAMPKIKRLLLGQKERASFTTWLDSEVRRTRIFRNEQLIKSINIQTRE